jgi:hypothetical protein
MELNEGKKEGKNQHLNPLFISSVLYTPELSISYLAYQIATQKRSLERLSARLFVMIRQNEDRKANTKRARAASESEPELSKAEIFQRYPKQKIK